MNFKYKILQSKSLINEEQLNELSNDGWDLISIVPIMDWSSVGNMTYYFYFKKYNLDEDYPSDTPSTAEE